MLRIILVLMVVTVGTVESSSGATFAGSSTWGGRFRVDGTLDRVTDANGFGGVTDIVATVENGAIQFNTLELRSGTGSDPAVSTGTFIDPITFQSTTITSSVTVDAFSYSVNHQAQSLVSNGGQLEFSTPNGGSLTITGSYSITGSTESVSGTFINSFSFISPNPDETTLEVSDFPDSVTFDNWSYSIIGGIRTTPIANRTVDGVPVTLEFSFNRNGISPFGNTNTTTLQAVPEPSAVGLLGLVCAGALLRRRR